MNRKVDRQGWIPRAYVFVDGKVWYPRAVPGERYAWAIAETTRRTLLKMMGMKP